MDFSTVTPQIEYGPPMSPFNQLLSFLPQIMLIATLPLALIIGIVVHRKKSKKK